MALMDAGNFAAYYKLSLNAAWSQEMEAHTMIISKDELANFKTQEVAFYDSIAVPSGSIPIISASLGDILWWPPPDPYAETVRVNGGRAALAETGAGIREVCCPPGKGRLLP